MTLKEVKKHFNYNVDYIYKNQLSKEELEYADIDLVATDEIFVAYPMLDYYVSNYGRAISCKNDEYKLLAMIQGGGGYIYYKFTQNYLEKPLSISAQRAVADIFCPNLWDLDRNKEQAHHYDHNKLNNYYKNIILLPSDLHYILNHVACIALYDDVINGYEVMSPYDVAAKTGATLEEIILLAKKEPLKTHGKYTIFVINDNLVGFNFIKKEEKGQKAV